MKRLENLEKLQITGTGTGQDFLTGLGCGMAIGAMAFPITALVGASVAVSCIVLLGNW